MKTKTNEGEGYLRRLACRTALTELKRQAAFGVAVSTIVIALGAWNYFFVLGANDAFWIAWIVSGVTGLLAARVFPSAWMVPERTASRMFQKAGSVLFALLLTALYFSIVTPVGLAMRLICGPGHARWSNTAPPIDTGWVPKHLEEASTTTRVSARSLIGSFLFVLGYFHARRQYVLFPFLVIVLSFGLLLFFVKSSALAPFIYTLF